MPSWSCVNEKLDPFSMSIKNYTPPEFLSLLRKIDDFFLKSIDLSNIDKESGRLDLCLFSD